MVWTMKDAQSVYDQLRAVSAQVLKALGCHTEPHEVNGHGKTRTRPWGTVNGLHRYRGILYHFTAGVSGAGSLRWGNHPDWGNTGCSWHATIFDRMTDNIVGEIWSKIDPELRRLFPVPTIIMADFRWGTWHGNWTNNVTLGVENRNCGPGGMQKVKKLGKEGVDINGLVWEPYTREQMICNINFGRMANGWIDGQLDPDWVLTHQCVWATKMDTGPLFAIHKVRDALFTDDPLEDKEWLGAYDMAPDTNEDDDAHWESLDELREEAAEDFVKWVQPSAEVEASENDPAETAHLMYRLGFNTGPELAIAEDLRKQVRWFQRSTGGWGEKHPDWVLSPDGVAGPKTHAALHRRIEQLKLGT
jgi:hypothetical protein